MTNSEYLMSVVNNKKQSSVYSYNETTVYNYVSQVINNWYSNFKRYNANAYFVTLEIKQSGSRAKGTAIKGKSDIDIFLSFNDPNGYFKLKELYDEVYSYLNSVFKNARKQNVSIGIRYGGFDIDVVPARRVNSASYIKQATRYNDHYLWSNRRQNRMLTNIQKHIDLVKYSGLINEIILIKVWREQKGLDFPSIYLELFVIEAFEHYNSLGQTFENRICYLFSYIRNNIDQKRIVDPGNSGNILSDELNLVEKNEIKRAARAAIDAQYWTEVVK